MYRIVGILTIAMIAVAPVLAGQGKGKGRGRGGAQAEISQGNGRGVAAPVRTFRAVDRTAIVDFYRSQPGGLPPGMAKRDELPPGLQKQIRRNGKLPPGLEKRLVPFPPELDSRLPPCPAGVQRGFIGGVAIMWNTGTGLVLDAAALFTR